MNPITKLVQPHGLVLWPRADSDHEGIDRALDDYATGDDIVAIPLRNRAGDVRAYAYVDAADAHLGDLRWNLAATGYASRRVPGGREMPSVLMHRQIAGLTRGDELQVDHINGDKLDNRRCNLRVVTKAQNGQNIHRSGGTSQYRGVSWDKTRGRWEARIHIAGKAIYLGRYEDELEAARVAEAARGAMFTHANEERHSRVAA